MSQPQMFLIAGVNGSGKSNLGQSIKEDRPLLEVIDPDAIAKRKTGSYATIDSGMCQPQCESTGQR